MNRNNLIILSILIFACTTIGCKVQATEKAPTPVKIKAVERSATSNGVKYSASIMPRTQVDLAFKVGGYVDALHKVKGVDSNWRDVQEGDVIAKGTVLAQVRQSDFAVKVTQAESQTAQAQSGLAASRAQLDQTQANLESSKAQLLEAQAAFDRAKEDFDRAQNLFASQSLTKADYDAAKAQFEMTEAKLKAAKSQVAVVQAKIGEAKAQIDSYDAKIKGAQAQVAEAAIPLRDTALRAPMNCIVLQKKIEMGTLTSPGTPVFVVADTTAVKAMFGVPDVMVKRLKLGDTLKITTEAALGEDFRGQITAISPAADAKSRVFDIEVTIPNAHGLLKVGMIASLTVEDEASPALALPVVPLSAVVKSKSDDNSYAVFVIEEQGSKPLARLRNLKLGDTLGNTVAVLEGLKTGERVITTGANLLQDGDRVQIIP